MSNQKARREFRKKFHEKQNMLEAMPGKVGDGLGNVETSANNVVWVRINNTITTAITHSAVANDQDVLVGYSPYQPGVLTILGQRLGSQSVEVAGNVGLHANTHELFAPGPGGGTDPVFMNIRQFQPLKNYPGGTLTIAIYPGYYTNGTDIYYIADTSGDTLAAEELDLSSYAVSTSGKAKYIRITLDNSGNLVTTEGSEVDIGSLALSDIPAKPTGTIMTLGAVRMRYGQTVFQEAGDNTDFADFRFSNFHDHDGNSVTLALDDLSDVTITAVTEAEILQRVGSLWINRTFIEADIASITYVDAEITTIQSTLHLHAYNEDHSGECDGTKTNFIAANFFEDYTMVVYQSGVAIILDTDYTVDEDTAEVIMTTAPLSTDTLVFAYIPEGIVYA